jgi:hypothetical protein
MLLLRSRLGGLLIRKSLQQEDRRLIYSIDGVFDTHLKEDTIFQVEKYWKPRLATTIPKVRSVLRIRNPRSGIRCFFTPWIRDPDPG